MKHIQFIKTVHPNTHRSVYQWAISSFLLIVASILVMAYISVGQWRLMSSFSEEKNRLMHHESEHAAIIAKKTSMLENKAICQQKISVIGCHVFGLKKYVSLIQEIMDLCVKHDIVLRSFKVKKEKITLYCLIQSQIIPFVDSLSAIVLLKNVQLVSVQKKGNTFAVTVHADFR